MSLSLASQTDRARPAGNRHWRLGDAR
uniref:Uncharacterized protein n=1 Tax=Anguilla anguilla TaxID=7936 RepID=A0A0E9RU71_ANGAN